MTWNRTRTGRTRSTSSSHREVIHDDRDGGAIHQADDPSGVRRIDRIGQPDVVDAGGGEDFRLPNLRAADTHRTSIDLPSRDDRGLMRFRVRAELHACSVGERLSAVDVPEEPRMVDEDLRRRQIGEEHLR